MKKLLQISMILTGLLTSNAYAVGGSDGTRGGGEGLRTEQGTLRLRDLIDPSICQYRTGEELRKNSKEMNSIFAAIAKMDWYFAAGLKHEVDQLNICFTKQLVHLPRWSDDRNWDSVIDYDYTKSEQVAIRFLDSHDVYINRSQYAGFESDLDRDFLIIHEAIHSFIPKSIRERREKVLAAVNTLYKVYLGEIVSPVELHKRFDRSEVNYPKASVALKEYRKALEWSLLPTAEQLEVFLKGEKIAPLFVEIEKQELLYASHIEKINKNPSERLSDFLVITGGNNYAFARLVNSKEDFNNIDQLLVAIGAIQKLSESLDVTELYKLIVESPAMIKGPKLFAKMQAKALVMGDHYRVMGTNGYSLLGENTQVEFQQSLPALSVVPFTTTQSLSAEVAGFISLIAGVVKREGVASETLNKMIISNNEFYTAFGVSDLLNQLQKLNPPIAREKVYLQRALPQYVRGFRKVLNTIITQQVDEVAAKTIDQKIDWQRLGLTEGEI
ncbi:MAG TPA: hypothetical protein PLJ21_04760 [Pseudobdellovibrionaceae bacterium]|nr:hypothetical protein [Pseudobdellovibrionaceae bacterium]